MPFSDAEVNDINKQKFLAELGKLLTFMYEEDRQTALSMYDKMFDDTADEQGLIQFLVSPTRQAVVIARAYNARARKLEVESQSREGAEAARSGELPEFVLAIDRLYQQVIPVRSAAPNAPDNQFSFFENAAHPVEDGMDEVFPVYENRGERVASERLSAEDGGAEDAVGAFLEEFSIPEEELEAEEAETYEEDYGGYEEEEPVRKLRLPLLILYLLLGVPVTLLGVAVLLVPTLLFLVLTAAAVSAGSALLVAAFGGFKILADFLLLFGAAVMLLALGLLFLWVFIWFICGAIVGLVTGVIALGRRWCYREVAA